MLADRLLNPSSRAPVYSSKPMGLDVMAKKRATLGASLLLVAPGIVPVLGVAEETPPGKEGTTPIPAFWGWERAESEKCVLSACRDLIRLRRNAGGNTRGLSGGHVDIYHVNQLAQVVGVHQWQCGGAGDSVIIVANLAPQTQEDYRLGLPAPGTWHVRFSSDWVGYDPGFATLGGTTVAAEPVIIDRLPFSGLFCIPASTLLILSQ